MEGFRYVHIHAALQRYPAGFVADRHLTLSPVTASIALLLVAAVGPWEALIDDGDLYGAAELLRQGVEDSPDDEWILHRLAWVCNRLELYGEALEPAMISWERRPWDQWYLAEYMRAMRGLGMTHRLLELGPLVTGGGVCRYYLARVEMDSMPGRSPSLDHFSGALSSPDDSTAADAAVWLSLLLQESLPEDSLLSLLRGAVERIPDSEFYRALLAERLVSAGLLEEARAHISFMRMYGASGTSYWGACASLAEAEGDSGRMIWALTRAVETRKCPGTVDDLGWALYVSGRDLVRQGDLAGAEPLLRETLTLGDGSQVWFQRADSLLGLVDAYQAGPAADR